MTILTVSDWCVVAFSEMLGPRSQHLKTIGNGNASSSVSTASGRKAEIGLLADSGEWNIFPISRLGLA